MNLLFLAIAGCFLWGCCIAFVLLVLCLLRKVTFHNKLLGKLGDCSLEIYLLHGFFLQLFRGNNFYISDPALWVSAVVVCSVLSGWGFHWLLLKIRKT